MSPTDIPAALVGVDGSVHLIHATPADWLVERSATAALVVVGSRGAGGSQVRE